jgi:hypothetical protein
MVRPTYRPKHDRILINSSLGCRVEASSRRFRRLPSQKGIDHDLRSHNNHSLVSCVYMRSVSGHVDAGLGPKPEPVIRPAPVPVSWKMLWVSMAAPGNPSV